MNNLLITSKNTIQKLYQITYDTISIFDNNGLFYFADGGTLLGCVRHTGIIPWDDDVDLCIMEQDTQKFLSLRRQFKKCGYGIVKASTFGYKIFYLLRKHIKGFNYSFPFIDIFLYKKIGSKFKPALKDARDIWPAEWFTPEQLFPIKKYKFGNFELNGPNTYTEYFNRLYGKDWNDVAYRQYNHTKEEEVTKVKVALTKKDRVAAQPTYITNKSCIHSSKTSINNIYNSLTFKYNLYPLSIPWRLSYILPVLKENDDKEINNTLNMLLSPVRNIHNLKSHTKQKKINNFLRKHEVIVTMTTSPLHLQKIVAVLSTLDYTNITKVNIVLPKTYGPNKETYNEIPKNLTKIMKDIPKIQILRVKKDLGPITKMLPTIMKTNDKKSIIISIDDDVAYPMGMINEFIYQKVLKHKKYVLTMGQPMPFFYEVTNMNKHWPEIKNKKPFVDIVEGWSSVLYSPNIVNTKCMKKLSSLTKECFLSDDFVISYVLSISNVKRLSIYNKYAYDPFPYSYGTGEDALYAGRGLAEKKEYKPHSDAINYEKYIKCLNTIAEYVHKIKKSKNGSDPCGFRQQKDFVAKTCIDETILNVNTRRCVKQTGSIGKRIIKDQELEKSDELEKLEESDESEQSKKESEELELDIVCDKGAISEQKSKTSKITNIGEFSDVYCVAKGIKPLAALDFSEYGIKKFKKLNVKYINKIIDFANSKGVQILHKKQKAGMYLKTVFFLPTNYNKALLLMHILWNYSKSDAQEEYGYMIGTLLGYSIENIKYFIKKTHNILITNKQISVYNKKLDNMKISLSELEDINIVKIDKIKNI
jgi:lipopolysaccharide cholinephosphotransferase